MKPMIRLSLLLSMIALPGFALAADETAVKTPSDSEIAQIVVSANMSEIDAAKLAESKTKNAEVKSFAQMMIKDHSELKKNTLNVAKKDGFKPKDSDISKDIASKGKDDSSKLKKLKGADFDKEYIDQQIAAHEAVLKDINETLLPNAKSDDLKALLEKAKPAVEAHLQHAKDLQAKLAGGNAG